MLWESCSWCDFTHFFFNMFLTKIHSFWNIHIHILKNNIFSYFESKFWQEPIPIFFRIKNLVYPWSVLSCIRQRRDPYIWRHSNPVLLVVPLSKILLNNSLFLLNGYSMTVSSYQKLLLVLCLYVALEISAPFNWF